MNLLALLPLSTPVVAAWAGRQQRRVLAQGEPLDRPARELAASVGVLEPQRIRLLHVARIPFPGGAIVDRLALHCGLPGTQVDGLTLGYAIYLRHGAVTRRLLAHECRHVQQFEQAGSLHAFLAEYLRQVARHGYHDAPFERDARMAAAGLRSPAPD